MTVVISLSQHQYQHIFIQVCCWQKLGILLLFSFIIGKVNQLLCVHEYSFNIHHNASLLNLLITWDIPFDAYLFALQRTQQVCLALRVLTVFFSSHILVMELAVVCSTGYSPNNQPNCKNCLINMAIFVLSKTNLRGIQFLCLMTYRKNMLVCCSQ